VVAFHLAAAYAAVALWSRWRPAGLVLIALLTAERVWISWTVTTALAITGAPPDRSLLYAPAGGFWGVWGWVPLLAATVAGGWLLWWLARSFVRPDAQCVAAGRQQLTPD